MLSIEKKMVNQISNFNEEVIKVFMKKKDRRIDLEFKNITTAKYYVITFNYIVLNIITA